jgi:hypothetical protein
MRELVSILLLVPLLLQRYDDHNTTSTTVSVCTTVFTMASLQQQASSLSGDSHRQQALPKEIINAIKEAKARGLPDGWTCVIDVSHPSLYLLVRS